MPRNTTGLKRGGPGRPKGVPNRATIEVRESCRAIVEDPEYRARLKQRALTGRLNPAVEVMLWHFAYGKPRDVIEQTGELVIRVEMDEPTLEEHQLGGSRGSAAVPGRSAA